MDLVFIPIAENEVLILQNIGELFYTLNPSGFKYLKKASLVFDAF